ncbi:DUF1707 domain-containing protein [Streptomyces sp. Isolate_219]|uniref:DUF1707 SHOCT-like domain-containing protein n=1 Tax=Streptomyces sp. Isolate_219 TaxID=2950110 RepID=UPI0021C79BF6|nr:DUF1707 domain-containing protein [Streptomyces sp. Isolate_219]MCR8579127.1 DUF1707 domain-containing protein [Streptomyces sp. Isolate_219]
MTSPSEEPQPRISEDDRDSALRRLQHAFAEGHISHEDMDERLHRVLSATSRSELDAALASLPLDDSNAVIAAAGGRIKRRGAWRVPRNFKVESAFGRLNLDLSRAIIEHPVIDIELLLGTGRATITVPRDAIVNVDGLHTAWKDTDYRANQQARPGGPKIRISGTMGYGRLKIRHARH